MSETTKAHEHLASMMEADAELYERILDTPAFAYHFNELTKLAVASATAAERQRLACAAAVEGLEPIRTERTTGFPAETELISKAQAVAAVKGEEGK